MPTETITPDVVASHATLLAALKEVMAQLESGVLVRDFSRDAEPNWALRMVPFVTTMTKWHFAIIVAEKLIESKAEAL